MSSSTVRTDIKAFIAANLTSETLIDLTGEAEEIHDLLARSGVTGKDPWLGVQFLGGDELPITIASGNDQGKYRETGAVYLHVVEKTSLGIATKILTRGEIIRNAFRGQRIGSILIESVTPLNFSTGATIQFEGGYTSGAIIVTYEYEFDL